jgi:hypothetical protein
MEHAEYKGASFWLGDALKEIFLSLPAHVIKDDLSSFDVYIVVPNQVK